MKNNGPNRRGSFELGAYGDLVPDEEAGQLDGTMAAGRDHLPYAAAST
jgi:hypothetical protein